VVFWLGRDQRGHRWPFVGEHPDIALRADQYERRARDIQRVRLLTAAASASTCSAWISMTLPAC
jgi:hypothetical protein